MSKPKILYLLDWYDEKEIKIYSKSIEKLRELFCILDDCYNDNQYEYNDVEYKYQLSYCELLIDKCDFIICDISTDKKGLELKYALNLKFNKPILLIAHNESDPNNNLKLLFESQFDYYSSSNELIELVKKFIEDYQTSK
jgi:hypothetical protein